MAQGAARKSIPQFPRPRVSRGLVQLGITCTPSVPGGCQHTRCRRRGLSAPHQSLISWAALHDEPFGAKLLLEATTLIHDDDEDNAFTPSIISGKALERYFELNDALFEFSKLFDYEEKNDRAIAIVGATFLDTVWRWCMNP